MIKKVVLGTIGLFFGLFVGILVAGDAIATAVLPHGHPTAGLLAVPVIGVLGCLVGVGIGVALDGDAATDIQPHDDKPAESEGNSVS